MPTGDRCRSTSGSKPLSRMACSIVVPTSTSRSCSNSRCGVAKHSCTRMRSAIHGLRALAEGIDHAVGDDAKHRADQAFQHPVRELIVQVKLDLAGVLAQGFEMPGAVEALEGTVDQRHLHLGRRCIVIGGGEALLDAVIVDIEAGHEAVLAFFQYLDTAAPWQKLGIILDIGDQIEHLLRAITEKYCLMNYCHG